MAFGVRLSLFLLPTRRQMREEGLTDSNIQQILDKYVANAMNREGDGSAFDFPSIADLFGVKTENPFLNFSGIFSRAEEPHHQTLAPENLERARQSNAFQRNMLGMMSHAMPFLAPIWGAGMTGVPTKPKGPTAKFIGFQEVPGKVSMPIYNIIGGMRHGSTVTVPTLKEEGIPIPETPKEGATKGEPTPLQKFAQEEYKTRTGMDIFRDDTIGDKIAKNLGLPKFEAESLLKGLREQTISEEDIRLLATKFPTLDEYIRIFGAMTKGSGKRDFLERRYNRLVSGKRGITRGKEE